MEEITNKTKLKINMCAYRRLSIQHEIDENLRKQTHLSNLHSYKYQEQLFHRKLTHLRKNVVHNNSNDEQVSMAPNRFSRVQNHFRYLNFSPETEKRLLSQANFSKQSSNRFPNRLQKRTSPDLSDQKTFQSYFNQSEQAKQMKNNQRKIYLLKEFDQLKHTIDDPHSTLSVLAALSRTFLFFDSATE